MTEPNTPVTENTLHSQEAAQIASNKKVALLVYILQAVSFLIGISSVIGLIINYLKRADVKGTWLESHFRWQIRTFWYGLLWMLIGMLLTAIHVAFALFAFIIFGATILWFIYRIVKGWLALNDNKALYP